LVGDLASGKTAFVQGFAKALGIKEKVTSPTFVLMKKFETNLRSERGARQFRTLVHVDAYRIDNPKEIVVLGWTEILKESSNIILVEWADRIKEILPKKYFLVKFKHLDKTTREVEMSWVG
jgi:tRNA threonylcarbamoyladenosine biosynthesis protein TsaE